MSDSPTSVLDASALLAHLNDEAGADVVDAALIQGSAISAVNLAEVLSKLAELDEAPAEINDALWRRGLLGSQLSILPLTAEDAVAIAELHVKTRSRGLSLGDRACLALARRLQLPALTADRDWARLAVGVRIETIRS